MNRDSAATNAKFLAESIEQKLKKFFEKSLVEKLETIREKAAYGSTPLKPMMDELIADAKESEADTNHPFASSEWDSRLCNEIKVYCEVYFEHLLHFIALQGLLASPFSYLPEKKIEDLKIKNNLSSSKLQKAIFDTLKKSYLEDIKRGGDRKGLNKGTELVFFATFNRFKFVVDYSLEDFRDMKKGKVPLMDIKRELQQTYEIPDDYIDAITSKKVKFKNTFQKASPKEIALYWSQKFLELPASIATLDDIEESMRKELELKYPNKILIYADFPEADCGTQKTTFRNQDLKKEIKFSSVKRHTKPELHFIEI
ncbi:MAG: hypothetical protein WKF90_11030 [Pyrinomonadaceae bacterium]